MVDLLLNRYTAPQIRDLMAISPDPESTTILKKEISRRFYKKLMYSYRLDHYPWPAFSKNHLVFEDSIAPFEATPLHYRVRLELRAITYFKIVTSCALWRHPDVFLGIARLIRSILA